MKPHQTHLTYSRKTLTLWQTLLLTSGLCVVSSGQTATLPPLLPIPLTGVSQLWSGGETFGHSCVLMTIGGIKCWGWNYYGQLGDGTTTDRLTAVSVTGFETSGAIAIVLGESHSCALTPNGGVKCWGENSYGQLGNGTTTNSLIPIAVRDFETNGALAIAAGTWHSCALTQNGGVRCWGNNSAYQLGNSTSFYSSTPVAVTGFETSGATSIALGTSHSCTLTSSGGVKCWGSGFLGQLGNGTSTGSLIPVPVTGFETSGATIIALGQSFSCVLTSSGGISGGIKCWGSNFFGELGNGTFSNDIFSPGSLIPVDVVDFETSGAVALASGHDHSCTLTLSTGIKCWGNNHFNQLGNGTSIPSSTPVAVTNFETSGAVAIAVGNYHSCALTPSGGVKCWGTNNGRLGDNTTTDSLTPVDVLTYPDLELRGKNNTLIPSGHSTPTSLNGTDFGQIRVETQAHRSFILQNTVGGSITLLGSASQITCNGGVTPVFNLVDTEITPSSPYVFDIGLTPHTFNTETCTVTLVSNDPDENPYTFTLALQGVDKPLLTAHPPTQLTRAYGTDNPPFPPTYTGWTNSVESIDIPPTFTTLATPTSPPGDYPITCTGNGQDDNYHVVCDPQAGTLTITAIPTKTTLTQHTPNPSSSDSEVTFSVTVRPIRLTPELPTGEVQIYQDDTLICQASLNNTVGTCSAPLSGMGPITLSAVYLGDTAFQESTSDSVDHFLLQAGYVSTPASGEPLHFGIGPLNAPLTTSLNIQETGNQSLTITALSALDDTPFKILTSLPATLTNGGPSFSLLISCTPTSSSLYTATLKLATNDPHHSIVTYPLTCEGQSPPGYTSSPSPGEFLGRGNTEVGQSLVFKMTIQENGDGDLNVDSLGLEGPQAQDFQILSPTFPFTIKDKIEDVQTIAVRCTPSALGKREAILTLSTNDPQHPTPTYPLLCYGMSTTTPGYYSLPDHDAVLNFGTEYINHPLTFALEMMETGNAPLIVEFKGLSGPQAQDFSLLSPPFPLTIEDGAPSQKAILRCIPSETGLRIAYVTFSTNDPQHPLLVYTLQCGGREALSPPEITDITLSNRTIALHTPMNHAIGTFQTTVTQPSPEFHFVYRLLDDAQGLFTITDDRLILAKTLAFERPEMYQITVKSTETNTGIEKNAAFVIQVNHENHAPTDIQLSHTQEFSLAQESSHVQVGERTQGLVGTLTTSDPDVEDTHTYTLINGGQFVLQNENEIYVDQGMTLKQPSYLIRVTSTDGGGLSVTKEFTIEVQPEAAFLLEGKGESDEDFLKVKSKQSHLAKNIVKVDESERVFLQGTFYPSRFHIGQRAELMFFYEWTPFGDTQPNLKGSHIFAHQEQLKTVVGPMPFLNFFKVVDLEGTFKVGLGYQIDDQIWSDPEMLVVQVSPNRPPTDLKLDMKLDSPLTDETPENTLVGILSMADPDRHEEFTYRLLSGEEHVKIEKNRLLTKSWSFFDVPTLGEKTYPITIQGKDLNGGTLEKTFELKVNSLIKKPQLTRNWVEEEVLIGTPVGKLRMFGPKMAYQYRLLDDAQGHFALENDQLLVHARLDFEEQSRYEIEVEVSFGEQRRARKFEIEVRDVQGR